MTRVFWSRSKLSIDEINHLNVEYVNNILSTVKTESLQVL